MNDSVLKLLDRKLCEFPILTYGEILSFPLALLSHSLSSLENSLACDLSSYVFTEVAKTCERYLNLANEPFFLEEKPFS